MAEGLGGKPTREQEVLQGILWKRQDRSNEKGIEDEKNNILDVFIKSAGEAIVDAIGGKAFDFVAGKGANNLWGGASLIADVLDAPSLDTTPKKIYKGLFGVIHPLLPVIFDVVDSVEKKYNYVDPNMLTYKDDWAFAQGLETYHIPSSEQYNPPYAEYAEQQRQKAHEKALLEAQNMERIGSVIKNVLWPDNVDKEPTWQEQLLGEYLPGLYNAEESGLSRVQDELSNSIKTAYTLNNLFGFVDRIYNIGPSANGNYGLNQNTHDSTNNFYVNVSSDDMDSDKFWSKAAKEMQRAYQLSKKEVS